MPGSLPAWLPRSSPMAGPSKNPQLAQLAELMNARDGLVRDRTTLKNREKFGSASAQTPGQGTP